MSYKVPQLSKESKQNVNKVLQKCYNMHISQIDCKPTNERVDLLQKEEALRSLAIMILTPSVTATMQTILTGVIFPSRPDYLINLSSSNDPDGFY